MNRRGALGLIGVGLAELATSGRRRASARGPVSSAAILTRPIPSTGEPLPVIGLGTWQTFDVGPSPAAREPLEEVLRRFVALGGKLVDSSPMYGSSEQVAGDLTRALRVRPSLFVATKVWTSGKKEGIAQMESSIRKLGGADLMQVHNLVDVATHLDTLRGWKQEGRIRYIGVTHYTAGSHADVARVISAWPVDFVQINYSVGEREAEQGLLPLARERRVAVIANRPFAGGDLFRRLRSKPLPSYAAEIDASSWAQLLLKFVVSHPAITCAIPATARADHLEENMRAGYGRLPDERLRARIAAEID